MKASELASFRKLLLQKRETIAGDVTRMEDDALKKSRQTASGDLSTMPYHMADIGTDNYEQEFTLGMLETEEVELRDIDDALAKIDAGTYGQCEECSKKISKARLKVIPYARLCIDCQKKKEAGSG